MSTSGARRQQDPLTQLGSRITAWVLGAGMLSLHVTVFTLSIIGLLCWNIYDAPADLWIGDLFRRWGVLLLFHALAVGTGWLAWRLLRAEQNAINASRSDWIAPTDPVYSPAPNGTYFAPTVTALRLDEQPRPNPAASRTDSPLQLIAAHSARWASNLGRAATAATRSATARLSRGAGPAAVPTTESQVNPVQTWPESPNRLRTDEQELIARFGIPRQPEFVPGAPTQPVTLPAASDRNSAADLASPSVDKDAGQTWVEAATAGRLSPREDETAADQPPLNGKSPHPPEPPPPVRQPEP